MAAMPFQENTRLHKGGIKKARQGTMIILQIADVSLTQSCIFLGLQGYRANLRKKDL